MHLLTRYTHFFSRIISQIGMISVGKKTPFYDLHVKANAKIVDFAGWEMPLHYGSQIEEHHQVRQHVGMFDVAHMGVVDLKGADVIPFLRYLIANNVDKLANQKALYTCMLNEQGGVIDDLIVYKIDDKYFRIVVNAGTREKDIAWMKKHIQSLQVTLTERTDLVILAVQGPEAKEKIPKFIPAPHSDAVANLKPFSFTFIDDLFIARTGYTGEDGYEMIFPAKDAEKIWQSFLALGIKPCGLAARDTLRLEAGLNLYGNDMDEKVTPFESNLAWTVMMEPKDRDFIGRKALEIQLQNGVKQRLIGLVLDGPGIIRNHQKVFTTGDGAGEVTSGGYSPTLEKSIALARVPAGTDQPTKVFVEIRTKQIPALVIKPPFVRHGKKMF